MGDQVKQAFQKFKDFWADLSPKIKKLFVFGSLGLLVFAVALTAFLNSNKTQYEALFPGMERAEAIEVMAIIQDMGTTARMDETGQVLVPTEQVDALVAQLSLQHYPKSTLTYDRYPGSSGLTTTDAEKRELMKQGLQDRLQSTFRHYEGVKNAIVTLNIAQDTNRVWETGQAKSTAQVSVAFEKGVTPTPEQVSGMKWAVAASVLNMLPSDVKVIDMATSINLRSTEDEDGSGVYGALERLNLERKMEEKIEEKALRVLTLVYAPEDIRVAATVALDYDKMLTESKKYLPSEQSTDNTGVLEHRDSATTTQNNNPAQGIPGEENNTDIPIPTYPNQLTDGNAITDSSISEDFAVGYIMEQIEKDRAQVKSATIAVMMMGDIDDMTRQSFITSVSKATNLPEDSISVESMMIDEPIVDELEPEPQPILTPIVILIAGGVFLLLLLILIISMIIAGKRRRQQEALLEEAGEDIIVVGDQDAEFNLQKELEERKRQLRELSQKTADDAIAEEVRDFAKNNPEITANLLRAWMREEIE